MQYTFLGATNLRVSRLCFGSLTLGPLQNDFPVKEGARIIRRALELGVNFIDTAQLYGTYKYIREAVSGYHGEVYVASKSYAFRRDDMAAAVNEALRETGLERLGLFLLHETESLHTIRGHWPAVEYLIQARAQGKVAAIGISTHHVAAVRAASQIPEIDVISPLINRRGLGIADGTREDMLAAIREAKAQGKGIYAMKPLGGGHMAARAEAALRWLMRQSEIDAIAVGMKSIPEVELNCRILGGEQIPPSLRQKVAKTPRRIHIDDWCTGCGQCVQVCTAKAMKTAGGKAVNDPEKCIFCGYCAAACPEFAIKVI